MDSADYIALFLILIGAILSMNPATMIIGIPLILFGIAGLVVSRTTAGVVELINNLRGTPTQSQATVDSGKVLFSSQEHDTIYPESFIHYEFEINQPAILENHVDILGNERVNVILTTSEERERFNYRQDIRVIKKGSQYETSEANIKARLQPGSYSIIIDNTGRWSDLSGDTPVDIEIDYEVRT